MTGVFVGLRGSTGEMGCERGDGVWRLAVSDAEEAAPPTTEAYVRGAGTSDRDCDLAEALEDALPALPCLSWLWLDVGRLEGRPRLGAGEVSF